MHPAPSVILFSTLSGLGFGLLVFLGLDPDPPRGWVAAVFFALALGLAVAGLLSATAHLKNKRNAWKAYREWRSSWLSREMWAAIAALLTGTAYAALLTFPGLHVPPLGWLAALLALATVLTTAMIYAQLRAVPRWNQWATPALFLALSLAGGAMLAAADALATALLILAAAIQLWHWWKGDRRFTQAGTTIATATRLSGRTTQFEAPHTGDNYLTREMVFQVARRHAVKLRAIALLLGYAVPAAIYATDPNHVEGGVALLAHLIGVLTTRWLFFAEAEHVVGLYYGAHLDRQAA